MAIEFVDLPINSMVDLSIVFLQNVCQRVLTMINHAMIKSRLMHYYATIYPIIIPIKPYKTI
jgi:hypothetical protein